MDRKLSQQEVDREIWEREPDLVALRRVHALLKSDIKTALQKLEALAGQGSSMSMLYLGSAYLEQAAIENNGAKAEQWFSRANDRGVVRAAHELGKIRLDKGNNLHAAAFFQKGADEEFSPSMYRLGILYLEGRGVAKDVVIARKLLEASSSKGHVLATRALGLGLIRGSFGRRDIICGALILLSGFLKAMRASSSYPYSDNLRS